MARDRLQAGLARATIVVQTSTAGGTMHATKATHAAGKPLFVLNVDGNDVCSGNRLLAEKQWASYISGETDLDALSNELKANE